MRLELSHDIIALKIWEQLPEQDKQVRLIQNSFLQRFNDFQQGKGSLLGDKELTAWEDFFPLLNLTAQQKGYLKTSSKSVKNAKKRRRLFILGLILTTILAIGTSFFAIQARESALNAENIAEIEKEKAQQLTEELLITFKDRTLSQHDNSYNQAAIAFENTDLIKAQKYAAEAQGFITKYISDLKVKKVAPELIAKGKLMIEEDKTAAAILLKKLAIALPKLPKYIAYMEAGTKLVSEDDYIEGLKKYQLAQLALKTDDVTRLIRQTKSIGYDYYLKKGMGHMEMNTTADNGLAVEAFDSALKMNRNSAEAKRLLKEVKQR